MKWVTRADCHVDRTACAWLIRRYIDPSASFVFVDDADGVPEDGTAFDIPGYPFSHHDGDCTFEVMIRHHRLSGRGLERLAQVVHEADLEDERFDAPEAAGLDAIVRGLGLLLGDAGLLDATVPIYDALLTQLADQGRRR
jgi:hypothetical protein